MPAAPSPKSAGRIRLSALGRSEPFAFDLQPEAETRRALADELNLTDLRKLRFSGRLVAEGRSDWRLDATLGATMVQPCGITLDPVTTRIDEPVERRFVQDHAIGDLPAEQEMPEDDTLEPLPDTLDIEAVMVEALALAVPAFPRAPGAEFAEARAAGPGIAPLEDDDMKPFAGLRDSMKRSGG